jgi:antitoxin (DNA-binding transcriptional repressor) of toxin-antitoxin stability system
MPKLVLSSLAIATSRLSGTTPLSIHTKIRYFGCGWKRLKQIKAWLFEYVRLAKTGETVLVTERDEVVAELRPARRQTPIGDWLEHLLGGLAASGEVSRAAQPKGDLTWRSRGLGLPAGTARDLLDELRQDRACAQTRPASRTGW